MEIRSFGSTDMRVSRLGLGCHELSQGSQEQVNRVLHAALAVGVNVIDTAECYGQSEEAIGHALRDRRDMCYLFTKCGHASGFDLPDWHPRLLEQSIERSLKRLQTEYLDLVQLHSCSEQTLRRGEVIQVLQRVRDAGKVRYIGYSGDRQAAHYAMKTGAFDALQTSVNIADQEAIDLTIPVAVEQGMGVIAKHPIANAVWKTGQKPTQPHLWTYWERLAKLKYDFLAGESNAILGTALRFTLSVPGVDVAIVGTTNPDRFQQNKALLAAGALSQAQFDAIRTRWKAVTWWRKPLPGGKLGWHGWA
ncbi:MAG: aldo/keto reductase [Ktedonobacteraceae bacterium]